MATKNEAELLEGFLNAVYAAYDYAYAIVDGNILTDEELSILIKLLFTVWSEDRDFQNG